MIGIIFSYVVGVNIYIMLALIWKGIKMAFSTVYNFCATRVRNKLEYARLRMKNSVELQQKAIKEEMMKQLGSKMKSNTQNLLQKRMQKVHQQKQRAIEQRAYEQKCADELAQCSGPLEVRELLKTHLIEKGQRDLAEQERIKKEEEEDLLAKIDTKDVDKVKQNEDLEKKLEEKQAKEEEEKRIQEEKLLAIHQLTKRFERCDYSDNILGELSCENLSNFYQRCTRELEDFWEIFQFNTKIEETLLDPENPSPYKDLFLETCYTYRISVDDAFLYQDFLINRIQEVEEIVDKYMGLLHITLKEKMKSGFERDRTKRKKDNKEGTLKDQVQQTKWEEWFIKHSDAVRFHDPKCYPYKKKMKIIVHYQEELIAADCNRKDNKLGRQDICRMTGSLSQSYFIFDAQQYKVGRKIYFMLEKDEVEEENNEPEEEDNQEEDGESDEKSRKSKYTKQATFNKLNLTKSVTRRISGGKKSKKEVQDLLNSEESDQQSRKSMKKRQKNMKQALQKSSASLSRKQIKK